VQSCVLIKFGEIVLKGRNRSLFYAQLRRNAVRLLRDLGPLDVVRRFEAEDLPVEREG